MNKTKKRIVADCEGCPLDKDLTTVDPFNMWMYDIGWAVVDRHGNVYETKSFVNADIFLNEKVAMSSAYYAEKIPQYWEDIKNGKRILTSFYNICKEFREDVKKWDVTEVYAHNMRFDYHTLNNTARWLSKSKYRYFFPKNVEICDTLKMSRSILKNKPSYRKFCEENGYLTKKNQIRLTAEIIYRFITKNNDFVESHTGLEDVMIEKEILAYCFRQHKKMNYKMWEKAC